MKPGEPILSRGRMRLWGAALGLGVSLGRFANGSPPWRAGAEGAACYLAWVWTPRAVDHMIDRVRS